MHAPRSSTASYDSLTAAWHSATPAGDCAGNNFISFVGELAGHFSVHRVTGYSLGGVINRFAAGKLYVAGVFEKVQPMNLITIASPHLGSFR